MASQNNHGHNHDHGHNHGAGGAGAARGHAGGAPPRVAFDKTQLLALLTRFTEALADEAFLEQLSKLAPNEDAMEDFLNSSQTQIIRELLPGMPPQAVFMDIGRASQAFVGDEEVLTALANVSLAEERTLAFALKKEMPSSSLIQITPQVMRQVAEQASKDPQAFQKQQQMLQMMYSNPDAMEKLQEHMKTLETSNPEAYAMFSQTLAASAFFAPAHEHQHQPGTHAHAPAAPGAQSSVYDDMPPLGDSDDDLEDNMV